MVLYEAKNKYNNINKPITRLVDFEEKSPEKKIAIFYY